MWPIPLFLITDSVGLCAWSRAGGFVLDSVRALIWRGPRYWHDVSANVFLFGELTVCLLCGFAPCKRCILLWPSPCLFSSAMSLRVKFAFARQRLSCFMSRTVTVCDSQRLLIDGVNFVRRAHGLLVLILFGEHAACAMVPVRPARASSCQFCHTTLWFVTTALRRLCLRFRKPPA